MSQFVVSARKYRPTTFDEVVGQMHVAGTLKNALQSDKLAHAFLFCGPRGVGKTTCARILAKVINCENPRDKVEPCNTCSSCQSFNDNASFNIFELDAASNNSVEHIRTLIEQVRFQPQQGSHKVFIIDEVHMLSTQAFNAFLKTLEEPPPYAIFILATTEKHKILPTILSRCQIFDFKRIQPADIAEQLKHIAEQEGKEIENEALHQIALKADGAMRDALSIFDKIASASGDKITYQDVVSNLNILDYDYFFRAIDACLRSDLTSLFLLFDEVVRSGFDAEIFVQGLASHVRDLLVSKDPKTIHLFEGSNELKMRYYEQSKLASTAFLLSSLNLLNECDLTLGRSNNKRLQVELALSKMTHFSKIKEVDVFQQGEPDEKKNTSPKPELEPESKAPESNTPAPQPVLSKPPLESPEKTDPKESNQTNLTNEKAELEAIVPSENKEIPEVLSMSAGAHLEAIRSRIEKQEAAKEEAQKHISTENIKKTFDAYLENHNSNSFQAALKNIILVYDEQSQAIKLTVPTRVAEGFAQQETGLMDEIREKYGLPSITLEIIVDKSQFPEIEEEEVVKTYFTRKEAFEELNSKNPKLLEFIQKLDLKHDDGQ